MSEISEKRDDEVIGEEGNQLKEIHQQNSKYL